MLEHEILLNLLMQVNLVQSETNHAQSGQIAHAHHFNLQLNFTMKSTLTQSNSSSCASAMMDVDIGLSLRNSPFCTVILVMLGFTGFRT